MDNNQRELLLNWTCTLYQEKSMDELRHSLVLAMEIEETRLRAQAELESKDEEIAQLKALLAAAIAERDEARESCERACIERALLQKQLVIRNQSAPHSGVSAVEDDCGDSIGSSSPEPDRPLPEKGKLLQAVVKAGPLLQTLLLTGGPLPEWRHPPPPIDTYLIPPPPLSMPAVSAHQESLHGNARKRGRQYDR